MAKSRLVNGLVPSCRCLFCANIEGEKAIEYWRFAIEMLLGVGGVRHSLLPVFEDAEPKQRPQDTCFHRVGSGIPNRLQDLAHGYGAEPGQLLGRLPVHRGYGERPKQDANIAWGQE